MYDLRAAALEAIDDGELDAAARHLREALDHDPDDAETRAMLALVLLDLGALDEAHVHAERVAASVPESPFAHWTLGSVLLARRRARPARAAAEEALRLAPDSADAHALLARVHALDGRWTEALRLAEAGLGLDAEHVPSAGVRALALRQLGRADEAGAAFDEVAAADPLSAFSNAGKGWSLLHRGDRAEAEEHFREALRLEPGSEWAREGLLATVKARNPLYRGMLRYFLWIETRSSRERTMFVVGGLLAYHVLRRVARAEPALGPLIWPLLALYVLFLFSSWLAEPLSNLVLRFDRDGRRLLSPDERLASATIGAVLLAALGAGAAAAVTGSDGAVLLALGGAFLLLPIAGAFQCEPGWPRVVMGAYAASIAVLLVVAVVAPDPLRGALVVVALLACGLGTWLARWLAGVLPGR